LGARPHVSRRDGRFACDEGERSEIWGPLTVALATCPLLGLACRTVDEPPSRDAQQKAQVAPTAPSTVTMKSLAPASDTHVAAVTTHQGMRRIPGGEFTMGTDEQDSMPNERPAHRVRVDAFWRQAQR
jgi:formylglycine-generating enzyme required for sulfatase activity